VVCRARVSAASSDGTCTGIGVTPGSGENDSTSPINAHAYYFDRNALSPK